MYYVYILTNKNNTVLYTGVTHSLRKRLHEHISGAQSASFTKKYNVNKLVYFEVFDDAYNAISREKQIKGWRRSKKLDLVLAYNPEWKSLNELALSF